MHNQHYNPRANQAKEIVHSNNWRAYHLQVRRTLPYKQKVDKETIIPYTWAKHLN